MRFKKYLPTKDQLRNTRSLKFLGEVMFEPNLWHFNRHSVSYAALIGIFCCFLPMPFQMVPCVILVVWVRCNMPLAIGLVWISNPVSMPPMMYFTYRIGTWILDTPRLGEDVEISAQWLTSQLSVIWQPLLLGSFVTGLTLGTTAFILVRIYWRWKVKKDWSMRKLRRGLRNRKRTG
ncbi:MAG: DUF2062 domain-containing protein [bacterium]|nr:DUF2062 domain-containing protein [Gammaproteobacteria bacterium]HIL95088.1 DUF2062 domain-containing protein [Pseudomonadales bacterium]